jgi:hypothetical protein
MELKIKMDGIEIELREYNINKLKNLINELCNQDTRAESLCKNLENELIEQSGISLITIIQLSKWCNTGESYAKAESMAMEISQLLFGKILPRLD